jgi:hypothetical protein
MIPPNIITNCRLKAHPKPLIQRVALVIIIHMFQYLLNIMNDSNPNEWWHTNVDGSFYLC